MATRREYLGRDFDFGSRRFIFRVEDAIEVDDSTWVEIERSRVYFDDVLAITYHKYRSAGFLFFTGIFAVLFGLLTVPIWNESVGGGSFFFGFFCFPFLLIFSLHAILGTDVIVIYGRRTLARIKYGYRKGRARAVWEDLVRRIQQRQAAPPPAEQSTREEPPPFKVPGEEEQPPGGGNPKS